MNSLTEQFQKLIAEYSKAFDPAVQTTLLELAEETRNSLASASPAPGSTNSFSSQWQVAIYHNAMYVHNTKLSADRIPLSNLLEYSRNGRPFVYQTFAQLQDGLAQKFVTKIQQKIK